MICAHCKQKFSGKPTPQGGEMYCSLECADLASGHKDEGEGYFEEAPIKELYPDEDE